MVKGKPKKVSTSNELFIVVESVGWCSTSPELFCQLSSDPLVDENVKDGRCYRYVTQYDYDYGPWSALREKVLCVGGFSGDVSGLRQCASRGYIRG